MGFNTSASAGSYPQVNYNAFPAQSNYSTQPAATSGGMDFLSNAMAGLFNMGNTAMASYYNQQVAKDQYKYNKKMAEYAWSKELDMWNRANEYNLPINQMERLKKAGINPHLAYAKGGVQNTGAKQLPNYNMPTADFSRMTQPVDLLMAQDALLKRAQRKGIEAQTKRTEAQTRGQEIVNSVDRAMLKNERIREYVLKGKLGDVEYTYKKRLGRSELYRGDMLLTESILKDMLLDADISYQMAEADLRIKKISADVMNLQVSELELQNVYKALEIEWRKIGVTSADHPVIRVVARILKYTGSLDYYETK